MGNKIDFQGLAQVLLGRARELCAEWLPGGRIIGVEYECGSLLGGNGQSLKVNIKSGMWADFATGEKGGDLISLYAAVQKIGQGEAARFLTDRYHYQTPVGLPPPALLDEDIVAPPPSAPMPNMRHSVHGDPSAVWTYYSEEGETLFYIARYEGERKQFVPWSYSKTKQIFVRRAWPEPRPLYGLEFLSSLDKPILLVEGEKAADAARKFIKAYIVMTWPSGSQAWRKVSWTSIHGRKILLWPDADEAGVNAMQGIAELLHPHCPEIKILDVTGQPDGWDAADSGFKTWQEFIEFAKPRASLFQVETPLDESPPPDIAPPIVETAVVPEPSGSSFALLEGLGIDVAKGGNPVIYQHNVAKVFQKWEGFKDLVWYDDFHKNYFIQWKGAAPRQLEEKDERRLMDIFQGKLGFKKLTPPVLSQALYFAADMNVRNEPRDWLDSLIWDENPRIELFLSHCMGTDDTPYTRAVSKNWFLSMAARIFSPGCKADNMVILEGPQGKGKSMALRELAGETFHCEIDVAPDSKNFSELLQGKFLVEMGEMASFSKAEINSIKSMITRQTDRYRAPYAKRAQDYPRHCVFVGTTNDDQYLKDSTGARRFWPVKIKNIDIDQIRAIREQLFAEAVYKFKRGETWHIVPFDEALAAQDDRRQDDVWEEDIRYYLIGKNEVTVKEIADKVLRIDLKHIDRITQNRIAHALTAMGWKSHNLRRGGKQGRVWCPIIEPALKITVID